LEINEYQRFVGMMPCLTPVVPGLTGAWGKGRGGGGGGALLMVIEFSKICIAFALDADVYFSALHDARLSASKLPTGWNLLPFIL